MFFLVVWALLGKAAAIITVTTVITTKMNALKEWVKKIAPDKIVVVTRKGTSENFSLRKYR
jgi:hypothetical protein